MKRYVSLKSAFWERLGVFFCRLLHNDITRPVQGQYVCLECMRRHSVNF
ncbi:MAG TPA: hypothetical protein VLX58_19115 [Bryobacteraceae bacterium]|nr:hypothetical protein [Bryobacteraceae bacterium]